MPSLPRVTHKEVAEWKRLHKAGWSYNVICRQAGRCWTTVRDYVTGKRKINGNSAAERQAEARAVPERSCGQDPPVDLEIDLSRVGPAKSGLASEEAAQRLANIRSGSTVVMRKL